MPHGSRPGHGVGGGPRDTGHCLLGLSGSALLELGRDPPPDVRPTTGDDTAFALRFSSAYSTWPPRPGRAAWRRHSSARSWRSSTEEPRAPKWSAAPSTTGWANTALVLISTAFTAVARFLPSGRAAWPPLPSNENGLTRTRALEVHHVVERGHGECWPEMTASKTEPEATLRKAVAQALGLIHLCTVVHIFKIERSAPRFQGQAVKKPRTRAMVLLISVAGARIVAGWRAACAETPVNWR